MLTNKEIIVSAEEPTINRRKIWFQHSKNMYDEQDIKSGLWSGGATIVANSNGYYIVLEIIGGRTYTISRKNTSSGNSALSLGALTTADYPVSGVDVVDVWKSGQNGNLLTIETSKNAKYLFIGVAAGPSNIVTESVKKLAVEELQIEDNTSKSSYEKHVEDKIFIKNVNGNYDEVNRLERFSLEGYQTSLVKTVNRSTVYKEGKRVTISAYLTMNEITSTSTVNIFKALPERFRPEEELIPFTVGKSDVTSSAFTFGALRKDGTIDLAQNPKMVSGTNIIFNFSYFV